MSPRQTAIISWTWGLEYEEGSARCQHAKLMQQNVLWGRLCRIKPLPALDYPKYQQIFNISVIYLHSIVQKSERIDHDM
jgi:hypothetical protein